MSPTLRYCGGISVAAGANVTRSAGTYYLDFAFLGGSVTGGLKVASGGSLTGTGVTIVLTSSNGLFSNLVNLDLGGLLSGGVINLTAPSSGTYDNLVVFTDPNALLSVLTFRGGTQNNFQGTIYAPSSKVAYALGGTGTKTGQCTRLIADTIVFGLAGASYSKCFENPGPVDCGASLAFGVIAHVETQRDVDGFVKSTRCFLRPAAPCHSRRSGN